MSKPSDEGINIHVLYVGATRSATFMGVPLEFFVLNLASTFIFFMAFYELEVLLIALPVHLVGRLVTAVEPRMFNHIGKYLMQTKKCPNKSYWRCQSYSPLGKTKI